MPGRDAPAPGPTASAWRATPGWPAPSAGWTGCATWTPWWPRRSAAARTHHAL